MNNYQRWYQKNKEHARKYKREMMKRLRASNPEKYREQSRKAKAKLKDMVFEVHGRQCARCGFSDIRALTLDHILNNGAEERKAIGERGIYRRAVKTQHKEEYQILCMNCQFIKRVEARRQNQYPLVAAVAWDRLVKDVREQGARWRG